MQSESLQIIKTPNVQTSRERLETTGLALEYFEAFEQAHHDFHSHEFIEILFVIRGNFRHITADRTFDEKDGGLTIMNYNQYHSLKTPKGPVELMNLYLNPGLYPLPSLPDTLASRLYDLIPLHPGLSNRMNSIQHLNVLDADKVSVLLKMLFMEQNTDNPGKETALQSLFRLFLIELCRAAPVRHKDSSVGYRRKIEKVCDYLEKNYSDTVRLEELCDLSGLNPANLCRRFKEFTGMSTGDFLKQLRLAAALQKLRMSDEKIIVISQDSGFPDVSRFNRSFRAAFGCTPSEYRGNFRSADRTKYED